jgi:GAF domain-containing protein
VLGAVSGSAHGAQRAGLIVIGGVLTAVAVGGPLWQQHRAAKARSDAVVAALAARAAMRVALEDALDPFVHLVGQLAQAKAADKPRLRGEAIQLAVTTIAALAGSDRVRVCFFVLDPGAPRTLRLERFAGRAGAPSVVLTERTSAGGAALRMLDRRSWTFINDTLRDRPRFWWDAKPVYRTLLTGPVTAQNTVLGMLTLDALHPGGLAQVDLALVRLLADLLATALCV